MDEDIFRAIGENLRRQVVEAMDNVALAAAMQDESGLRSEITREMNEPKDRLYQINFCIDKTDVKWILMLTFHRSLQVMGKRWNTMNKTVEDCRDALPDDGTIYFYIASNGDVQAAVFEDFPINHERFRIGNFFLNREEANGMAEKIKKLLKGE